MTISYLDDRFALLAPPLVLTFGNFDGLHRGHAALIEKTLQVARARELMPVALTFDPHPVTFFAPQNFRLLMPLGERLQALGAAGLAQVVVAPFTRELAELSAAQFVTDWLLPRFAIRHVVTGFNTTFGRDRTGSPAEMAELGAALGFAVDCVAPVLHLGEPISSTRIRRAVLAGDMPLAQALLGRPFRLSGEVGHGAKRGASLGFPTANLSLPGESVCPPAGVYAVWANLGTQRYGGALHIGTNPTFGPGALSIETHLLDYSGDCYGQALSLDFVRHLRPQERFASVPELTAQIARDVQEVRGVLGL